MAEKITEQDNIRADFARNLKRLMATDGITQKDICDKLSVSAPAVSAWVGGRKLPRPETIDALARLFDCDPSDLYDRASNTKELPKQRERPITDTTVITMEDISIAQRIARANDQTRRLILYLLEFDKIEKGR